MSLFLVFLAIVLIGVAVLLGTGLAPKIFRRHREGGAGGSFDDGFDEPVASLPPVLLPERAAPADIDRLRFAVGLRGYRMDQVDQVLDDLRDQIIAKDQKIGALDQKIEALGEELERLRPPAEERP